MRNGRDTYFGRKIVEIQYICSIIVIIQHSINIERYDLHPDGTRIGNFVYYLQDFVRFVAECAVPMFFVISAYLFFRNFSLNQYPLKLVKRFRSIYIPFLIWNIVSYSIHYVSTSVPTFASHVNHETLSFDWAEMVWSMAIWGYYPPFWYIRVLLCFFILSPVIWVIAKRKYLCIFSCLILAIWNLIEPKGNDNICAWLPHILLGAWLAIHYSNAIEGEKKLFWRKYLWLIILILGIVLYFSYSMGIVYVWRITSPLMIWLLYDAFELKQNIQWWKKISFFLYCSHFDLISIIEKVILIVFGSSWLVSFISFCLVGVFTIVLLSIIARLLETIMPKVYMILSGGRG